MITDFPIVTVLLLFPLAGGAGLVFLRQPAKVRTYALAVALTEFCLAIPLLGFQLDNADFQFVQRVSWVRGWGLEYFVGLDGISVLMVGLTVIILPLCVLCSWRSVTDRIREFHFTILLLASICIGVFSALDLVLFFLFWEALLVPVYLIISVWGGPERHYAALKFILYTLAGSALLLVAVVAFRTVGGAFAIPELMKQHFARDFQMWTFLILALAFAVKVPLFPFHTWLPAAYSEAPIAGSVLLSCILAKMGAYGFLRFCLPLTPDASQFFAPMMIALSIASILYGGFMALGQSNIKKIIAYSSLAHMGFVTLGIFLFNMRGAQGAVLQMVSHGITTAGLFILAGILFERSRDPDLSGNLGLGKYLPAFMGFWGFMAFAGFAFPGASNFVGEFLVLLGAFERNLWIGGFAVPGALLAAAYLLRPTQKMTWGTPSRAENWKDLNVREWVGLLPLAFLVLYIGLAPTLFFKVMTPSLNHLLSPFPNRQPTTAFFIGNAPEGSGRELIPPRRNTGPAQDMPEREK